MESALDEILASEDRKEEFIELLRSLALRALNDTQLLILKKVKKERVLSREMESRTLNALLQDIERRYEKSLSSLKMNAKILRELGLIEYGDRRERKPVKLTHMGNILLQVLEGDGQVK